MIRVPAALLAGTTLPSAPPGILLRGRGAQADSGKPLAPRAFEIEFLPGRVQDEPARPREFLAPEALAEYNQAVGFYRGKLEGSR